MRKRKNAVYIRLSDNEYAQLQNLIEKSGQTMQSYVLNASLGAAICTKEEVDAIKTLNAALADHDRQLRGIATNINQMAHVANGQGLLPSERKLEAIYDEVKAMKDEENKLWQSTRSLIGGQIHTPH